MRARDKLVRTCTFYAVLHHAQALADDRMEALIDEGARLATGYLKG